MDKSRLYYLMRQHSLNAATPAEQKELSDYLAQAQDDELFAEVMMEQMENPSQTNPQPYAHLAQKAIQQTRKVHPITKTKWRWAAAAACLLLFAAAAFLLNKPNHTAPQTLAKRTANPTPPIPPGTTGALLTLADGSTVSLDSLGNGKIASQNGADIILHKGKLAYNKTTTNPSALLYNTLSTPRGKQYRVQLPDGTEVWLNAASSIRFPTAFENDQRVVHLTGEAYFEVAKDPSRPFKIQLDQQTQINVLGTHFNVNAYKNEPKITTTVLEGSIRFNADATKTQTLQPDQQTIFDNNTHELAFEPKAETAKALAWKNGIFDFNNAGMKETMQQLERWYDIDVAYEGPIPDITFYGKMTRNITLNDLLVILEKSGVHFQLDGRKLIVKQ